MSGFRFAGWPLGLHDAQSLLGGHHRRASGLAGQHPNEQRSAMTTRGLNRGESMANFANGKICCGR